MPAQIKGKHNRRQRKKLRLGEFREFGFKVSAKPVKVLSPIEHEAFIDELIAMIEERDLLFAGGIGDDDFFIFVCREAKRQSTTDEDREAVRTWLSARPELKELEVGELEDAWFY